MSSLLIGPMNCLDAVNCEFGVSFQLRTYHASPKLMPPMHSGLTFTDALGERRRCLPRIDLGGGAGSMTAFFSLCGGVLLERKLAIFDLRMKNFVQARRWLYTCLEPPLPTLRTRGERASTSFGIPFGYLGRYDVAMIFLGLRI